MQAAIGAAGDEFPHFSHFALPLCAGRELIPPDCTRPDGRLKDERSRRERLSLARNESDERCKEQKHRRATRPTDTITIVH
jgi:hypothetical protein